MKNIVLPDLGEGIEKGIVSSLYIKEGDLIKAGDDVIELVTDKAAFNVSAEISGKVRKINVQQGQEVKIGEVLVVIE